MVAYWLVAAVVTAIVAATIGLASVGTGAAPGVEGLVVIALVTLFALASLAGRRRPAG